MLCSLGQAPVPSRLRASVGDANHSINAHRNLARQTLLCSRPFRLSSSSLVRSSKSGQPPVEEPVAASEEPVEQGQQDGHRRPFQRLREWVGRRAQALSMSQGPDDGGAGRPDTSILRLIRLGLIVAVFFCVALARELVVMRGHVTRTREVGGVWEILHAGSCMQFPGLCSDSHGAHLPLLPRSSTPSSPPC
jgi:hypothetical protein